MRFLIGFPKREGAIFAFMYKALTNSKTAKIAVKRIRMATKKPSAKTKEVDVSANAKAGKTKAKPAPVDKKPKLDVLSLYSDTMDVIAKRQNFESSGLEVAPPMSTGMLEVDMLVGGGIRACMLTAAGNEQCAKTTLALSVMASAIKEEIPIIGFMDFEGSSKNSKPYVASILKTMGVNLTIDQVFGKKDKTTGQWITPPRVRYRAASILERFYDWLSEILRDLPDKKFVEDKWWLVFEDNKKNKAKVGDFADVAMGRKYGNGLWIEAPNDKIQGIIFVDSYTAMNPEAKDEESISNQLSVKASAFSKQLERVKGRMADKMVTIYGLNHLRANPMAMFGPKEEEKGGQALRQFSDVRIRQTSRSLSASPFKAVTTNKQFNEEEKSVEFEGGVDEYRVVHLKTNKNKLWTPGRETFIRIWVKDGSGKARGLDPVFDTILFLKNTGQLSGQRKAFKLNLHGLGAAKTPVSWHELKLWVLGTKEDMSKISAKLGYKPMSLRAFCFKQIKSEVAEELYCKMQNAKAGKDSEDEE